MDEAADVAPENGRRGRAAGIRNYRNDLLIPIVEGILPQGAEGWRLVAASYKTASREPDLRDHDALRENWVKKLCNNFKKPTGRTGENGDRIARCIEIERRIQAAANAAILGVSSAESEHEDEDEDDDDVEVVASLRARPPRMTITTTPSELSGVSEGVDDEPELEHFFDAAANSGGDDDEVAPASTTATTTTTTATTTAATANSSARASSASGGTVLFPSVAPLSEPRSRPPSVPPSVNSRSSKTKNSTNRERGSMGKAIHRACDMFARESDGGSYGVLSMQMQQQAQNAFVQTQMLQQQISAIEKRAESTEKLLRKISKRMSKKGKKRAKTASGSSGSSSSSSSSGD